LAGRPITYVEIGCWEGASALWMAENVLTHPNSRGFGIDPYAAMLPRHDQNSMDERRDIAARQLQSHRNWTWIRRPSLEALRTWKEPIDCLYIDGYHDGPHPLMDFVLAWPHLNVGSVVIFDDYAIGDRKGFPCVVESVHAVQSTFATLVEPVQAFNRLAVLRVARKELDAAWYRSARITRPRPEVAIA
jgi:predicted O-methyltransferase YrrM